MSPSSLLTKRSHLVRRMVVSALIAATLVCGVVVGEGSAFARGGGRGGVSHARIGGFGRPIAPYRYGAPGYRYAPGYPGWRAAPSYWGVRPGWGWPGGRGYIGGGRGYVGGGRGYVGAGRGGYGGGGYAGGGHGGHGR
jgi:hypothetical protein